LPAGPVLAGHIAWRHRLAPAGQQPL